MDIKLIYEGKVALEDLYILYGFGYEFVVADGKVTNVYSR